MNVKLQTGKIITNAIDKIIELNYKLTPFIPNSRILPLDLKRANIYPKVIFDVGANIGQTSNYFIKHFPSADIYSFEPVFSTYQTLLCNVKNKSIHPFNEGLGAAVQNQTINKLAAADASGSSTLKADDGSFLDTEVVKINTGQGFCTQNQIRGIDLLKMDVEGYELEVLKGFGPMLKNNVKMIYSEVGFEKGNLYKTYISDLLEFTLDSGFVASGFYEYYRWGNGKLKFYCNILLTNTFLVDI